MKIKQQPAAIRLARDLNSHPNTFAIGCGPERNYPGDKTRRVTHFLKVTSDAMLETADFVDAPYPNINTAGTNAQIRALTGPDVRVFGKPSGSVVYDVKYVLPRDAVDGRL